MGDCYCTVRLDLKKRVALPGHIDGLTGLAGAFHCISCMIQRLRRIYKRGSRRAPLTANNLYNARPHIHSRTLVGLAAIPENLVNSCGCNTQPHTLRPYIDKTGFSNGSIADSTRRCMTTSGS